jgi:hypothetical protein
MIEILIFPVERSHTIDPQLIIRIAGEGRFLHEYSKITSRRHQRRVYITICTICGLIGKDSTERQFPCWARCPKCLLRSVLTPSISLSSTVINYVWFRGAESASWWLPLRKEMVKKVESSLIDDPWLRECLGALLLLDELLGSGSQENYFCQHKDTVVLDIDYMTE